MMTKTAYYMQMVQEAAAQITGSKEQWTAFLTTSARLYKYPFAEQLMIYKPVSYTHLDVYKRQLQKLVSRGMLEVVDVPRKRREAAEIAEATGLFGKRGEAQDADAVSYTHLGLWKETSVNVSTISTTLYFFADYIIWELKTGVCFKSSNKC